MVDRQLVRQRLREHLHYLTVAIGERSVGRPGNLKKTAAYISSFYEELGLAVDTQAYSYAQLPVANVIAEISFGKNPQSRYLLGAHYDSVSGTVGADDNASGISGLVELIEAFEQRADDTPYPQLTAELIEETGYAPQLRVEKTEEARNRSLGQASLLPKVAADGRRGQTHALALASLDQLLEGHRCAGHAYTMPE